jgi:hypothetical protein
LFVAFLVERHSKRLIKINIIVYTLLHLNTPSSVVPPLLEISSTVARGNIDIIIVLFWDPEMIEVISVVLESLYEELGEALPILNEGLVAIYFLYWAAYD